MVEGKRVRLEYDWERKDKYGRTLAYVYLEDSTFLNAEIIRQGYAGPFFMIASLVLVATVLLAACAPQVRFQSAAPSQAVTLSGTLYRPEGEGPFPAMVLHHGCDGVAGAQGNRYFGWASWLKANGYVALVVDSFSPRGIVSVCERRILDPYRVVWDAFGALIYLRSLPFVDPDRIGVMGWSFGGSVALEAANQSFLKAMPPQTRGFRVAVAFYPSCGGVLPDDIPPVLLLLAEKDDWYPAWNCAAVAKIAREQGRTVLSKVYPNATHSFDANMAPRVYLGHRMEYDSRATHDAEEQVRAFLAQYLRGAP